MEVLIVLAVAAFVALIVVLGIAQSRQANEAWSAAARQLGLTYRPPRFLQSRRIHGTSQDFHVEVDTYTQSSGKHSTTYTRFRVSYPPLGLGLRLSEEGFIAGFTKFFGAQDIELGDGAFDAGVLVKGSNARRVREFLTPARRMRVHRFLMSHSGATVDDREIKWRTTGVIRDADRLEHIVRGMLRLAWHLTGDREADRALGRALQAQDEGRPDEALALLRGRHEGAAPVDQAGHESELVEERMLEGELLYLGDRRAEAREVFQMAHRDEPDDPELAEWAKHVAERPARRRPETWPPCQPLMRLPLRRLPRKRLSTRRPSAGICSVGGR